DVIRGRRASGRQARSASAPPCAQEPGADALQHHRRLEAAERHRSSSPASPSAPGKTPSTPPAASTERPHRLNLTPDEPTGQTTSPSPRASNPPGRDALYATVGALTCRGC